MLDEIKKLLEITGVEYDDELTSLINSAVQFLSSNGITEAEADEVDCLQLYYELISIRVFRGLENITNATIKQITDEREDELIYLLKLRIDRV